MSTNKNSINNLNLLNNMNMNTNYNSNSNFNMMNMNMNMNYGMNNGFIMNPNLFPVYNPYQGNPMTNIYQLDNDLIKGMYNPHVINDYQDINKNSLFSNVNQSSNINENQIDKSEKKPKLKKKKKKEN